jgi:hypothetical protein
MALPYHLKQVCRRCHRRHKTVYCPIPFDYVMDACGVEFYSKQQEIIHSVDYNDETFVVAGNQLG